MGHGIGRLLKANKEEEKFKKTVLPSLFNCVYTVRKTDFLELILKIHLSYEKEVNEKLLELIRLKDTHFQVESQMMIIGILEKINHGEDNE